MRCRCCRRRRQGEQSSSRRNCAGQWTLVFVNVIVLKLLFMCHQSKLIQDVVFKATTLREHVKKHKERWGGDLLNINDVKRLVQESRDELIQQLKQNYGIDNYYNIFQVNGTYCRGRTAFVSAHKDTGVSIQRFKRRLKIKILAIQTAIQAERESLKESGENDIEYPDHYESFVWSTGGHSTAAGHGNLFNESFTAVMENAVSDIFGSIGIDFVARNHAMGNTASAPEIALCSEAIHGTDPDVITWDFGMSDGRKFFRKAMYNQRIGLNPSRPAIIDFNGGDKDRTSINQHVEDRGLASIYLDPAEFKDMEAMVPDTFGLSEAQVEAMPRYIRHYKCQDEIEKGDPTCGKHKFRRDSCPHRRGMVGWHPGWKRHALWGNLIALFLSDMLLDSISELGTFTTNQTDMLAQLRKEEDADYERFFESFAPGDDIEYRLVPLDNDLVDGSNVSLFFRNPSFCHTARLPAQIRHLGILTMSDQVGVHDYEYFTGISMKAAKNITDKHDTTSTMQMPLVYMKEANEQCGEIEIRRDFRSFFLVSSQMGPRTLTVPNDAERQAFGRESEKPQGIVVLCLAACQMGNCPKGDLKREGITNVNGEIQIDINDQPVTNFTDFGGLDFGGCSVLRGENGHRFQANDAGQYVVKARVSSNDNSTMSFVRISSITVL